MLQDWWSFPSLSHGQTMARASPYTTRKEKTKEDSNLHRTSLCEHLFKEGCTPLLVLDLKQNIVQFTSSMKACFGYASSMIRREIS